MTNRSERLIEQWLPINEISVESVREGGALAGHPPVNQLHVWWARRPLIASRAAIAASMLPVDADRDEFVSNIGTTPEVVKARNRMDAVKAEGGWSDISFPNKRAFLHNPDFITQSGEPAPVVLDVTAGGGSIPFEAGRLGFRTIANELNPVACLILRATCQWPQEFGRPLLADYREVSKKYLERVGERLSNVYPDEPQPDCANGNCPHPQRCRCFDAAEDGENLEHKLQCSKNHSSVRAQRYAQTYLWARTLNCPACDSLIPLSPNWRLDNKGTGIRLEPDGRQCQFRIVHNRRACPDCRRNDPKKPCNTATLHPDGEISGGTTARAVAVCPQPNCGATTPKGYAGREARAGRMGHQLYAVVYRDSWFEKTKSGRDKKRPTTFRGFAEATDSRDNTPFIESELARLESQWEAEDVLPSEGVPVGNDQRPHTYGMEKWADMFNPRQQLAHGHCIEAFRECVDEEGAAGRLNESRKAAWAYVGLALDKMINRNSLLCIWDPGTNKVAQTFANHNFEFKWSYAEMAVTCLGLGLEWSLDDVGDCLSELLEMTGHPETTGEVENSEHLIPPEGGAERTAKPSEVINSEAQFIPQLDDASVDCIVFDPPYEANVAYAELSDFFYVWLKRTAGYLFPDDFRRHLSDKDLEAIASPVRFRNAGVKSASARKLATQDYEAKMTEIFAECRRVIKPGGIMTVMFTHKSTAAWDALTVALINAGFSVTRTWPVKTEAESSMHIKDRAAARTTILLVCRPREHNPTPEPWHRVEQLIAKAVQDDIRDNLSQAGLKPIDLYLSAFGPALKVISEHWGTERETANMSRLDDPFAVTPTDALQVARAEVSKHRAQAISEKWADSPVDVATKFYILANDANGGATMEFDEANLLARAIGVSLDRQDPAIRSIAAFRNNKVSLLSAQDRMAAGHIGEDQTPRTNLDAVHTAVALTGRRNTLDAQQWLARRLYDPEDDRFKHTLEALIRTTKPGHDDHQAQRSLWQALYGEEAPAPATTQMEMVMS